MSIHSTAAAPEDELFCRVDGILLVELFDEILGFHVPSIVEGNARAIQASIQLEEVVGGHRSAAEMDFAAKDVRCCDQGTAGFECFEKEQVPAGRGI